MKENRDTFVLGGREFSSRFILGSGKYSMELIKAAVEQARAEIITLAVRRANTRQSERHPGLHTGGSYPSAQHFGSQRRRRSRSHRAHVQRVGLRRFCKN